MPSGIWTQNIHPLRVAWPPGRINFANDQRLGFENSKKICQSIGQGVYEVSISMVCLFHGTKFMEGGGGVCGMKACIFKSKQSFSERKLNKLCEGNNWGLTQKKTEWGRGDLIWVREPVFQWLAGQRSFTGQSSLTAPLKVLPLFGQHGRFCRQHHYNHQGGSYLPSLLLRGYLSEAGCWVLETQT